MESIFLLAVLLSLLLAPTPAIDWTLDFAQDDPEDKECHGTSVFFGYSGTLKMHYEKMKKRYTGCQHVIGNLEITNLEDPELDYDLDFLKDIRYVSGSVLIGLISEISVIPLINLEIIRGNKTYFLQEDDYSLVVALTSHVEDPNLGLKSLWMPKLREVTNGKVLFTENPTLGFIDTVDWRPIMRGRPEDVHFTEKALDYSASQGDSPFCSNGSRWGDDEDLCQMVDPMVCHEACNGRCFGPADDQCCHDSCAVGCSDHGPESCLACKDYIYDKHCAGFCPAKSYPLGQKCIQYE